MYVIGIALVVSSLLFSINLYLRGRLTEIIGGVLGFVIFIIVILAFVVLGWQYGLAALITPFIIIPASKPITSRIARRMLGYRTGIYKDYRSETEFNKFMSGDLSMDEWNRRDNKRRNLDNHKLVVLSNRTSIAQVLHKYNMSFPDYEELYWDLYSSSLEDLIWDVLGDPRDLTRLIEMKRTGKSKTEILAALREF